MDARLKIFFFIAFVVVLFVVNTIPQMAGVLAAMFLCYALAKLPLSNLAAAVKPMLLLIFFVLIFNMFVFKDPTIALINNFGISVPGLLRAVLLILRILGLVLLMALFTSSTAPDALIAAITKLLHPLKRVHFPVDDLALLLSIMLRFIPVIAEELRRIMLAQAARGASFNQGGLIARTKAYIPVLMPLFVHLFKRADTLACAMESRGYGLD
jgi:energy-coupling factor transport system permease protein